MAEEGVNLTYSFEFINDGKDTIHLKEESRDVRPGCSCTASEYTKEPIPPGAKGFIKAGYNTQGRMGAFNKSITVSQKGTPYKILTIKGVVVKKPEIAASDPKSKKVPGFSIDKRRHDFGKIEKGKNASIRFTVKNTGKDTLKILSTHSACNCIDHKLIHLKDNSEEQYVFGGKTVYLELTYKPSPSTGLSDSKTTDIVTLLTNDPKNPKIELSLQSEIVEILKK